MLATRPRWSVAAVSALVSLLAAGAVATSPTASVANSATTSAPSRPDLPSTAELAPRLTAATFDNPPAAVRPKYRWWLPMAYTEDEELRKELADMKAVGAGGVEVASFAAAGPQASSPEFLAKYGWGSDRWTEKVQTMLEAADELNLGLDLTIGPRWPATVPTVDDVNDPRAAQQLVFSHTFVRGGTTYDAALPSNYQPKPPDGAKRTLIAALVARCTEPSCDGQDSGPRMLDRDSVRDVTNQVRDDEMLTYDIPGDSSDTYAVIAFFQTGDGEHRSNLSTTKTNYYLDYLSEKGVKASTDFYESSILTPAVKDAIKSVGRVNLYEDSLELGGSMKWTWDFAEQWKQRRGYSPIRVLPALAGAGNQGHTAAPFFDFSDGSGQRIRTDYRQTWSDLYINARLDNLRKWSHDHGMALRVQPYGMPVDTPEAAMHADVPEGESLAFNHNIEDYKLVAAGAHMAGNKVVSNECCAARDKVWATTAGGWRDPGNLHAVYRGFAGGVTQIVWHGYPYLTKGTGGSPQTVWPGMSYGGNTSFAEAWGAKGGPNWQDYRKINDHIARLQLVLRQGKPKFDVGVYWQDFGMDGHGTTGSGSHTLLTSTSPLAERGYTYEYVSPAYLRLPSAKVTDGKLFPDAGAYEALVIKDQETLPVDTARHMLDVAREGLPIVIVGELPSTTPGAYKATARDAELHRILDDLVAQRNVIRADQMADVPTILANRGIKPAAEHESNEADITSVRRRDATTDYYYLFNQASWATEQQVTLQGEGRPYELDTWTGEITPLTDYRTTPEGIEVEVALEPADTKVIALSTRKDDAFQWEEATERGPALTRNHGLGPVLLDDWKLDVESWTPGESGLPGDTAKTALPTVEPVSGKHGALPPWSSINRANGYGVDLTDVSGVGTYTSTVTLDDAWDTVRGAYLDLGEVVDTATVTVNGTALPPTNPQDLGHIDVADYLHAGTNTVTVRVSSTLINAVRVAPGTEASSRERMDYGLLGPVRLIPYQARQPTLTVEALEDDLPLADGGVNQARIRIGNSSTRPVRVSIDAAADDGVEATPKRDTLWVPRGSAVTTAIKLRGTNDSGVSELTVDVTGRNDTSGEAHVTLHHSDNLALNTTGSPYPHTSVSSNQDRYSGSFATDGLTSTFWVSAGRTAGQAPTEEEPETITVDLGTPTSVRAIGTIGRGDFSIRTYDVQTSLDGQHWKTVASEVDAPKTGTITPVKPGKARYIRLHITDGWYPTQPGNNTQLREFAVYSEIDNLAWLADASASSTHSRFSVASVNDGSIAGQHNYDIWNDGFGWNDADKSTWPDTVRLTWEEPVTLSEARVFTVDSEPNPAEAKGLRDYDVQVLIDGSWQTVDSIRGNIKGTVESSFDSVTTTALRLRITDSNDHGYSRVVELEVS